MKYANKHKWQPYKLSEITNNFKLPTKLLSH